MWRWSPLQSFFSISNHPTHQVGKRLTGSKPSHPSRFQQAGILANIALLEMDQNWNWYNVHNAKSTPLQQV